LKKLIGIIVAISAVLAMTVPAFADTGVSTDVTVGSGGGDPPVVVAKWEYTAEVNVTGASMIIPRPADGDPIFPFCPVLVDDGTVADPGLEVLPPLHWQTVKPIYYFALVADPAGIANIETVYVDVWHPTGSPAPYNANSYHKYQLQMDPIPYAWLGIEESALKAFYTAAVQKGLVTIDPNYANMNIAGEGGMIDQHALKFFAVTGYIDYEQPAGTYPVEVKAVNKQGKTDVLDNSFDYIGVSMVDFDFNSVSYGNVYYNVHKQINGDRTFVGADPPADMDGSDQPAVDVFTNPGSNGATVRNVGNVWSQIKVKQSDLLLNGDPTKPLGKTGTIWNVHWDARLGDPDNNPSNGEENIFYEPEQAFVVIPRVLYLSSWEKLDFSILLTKNGLEGNRYTGTMTLGSQSMSFTDPIVRTGPFNPVVPVS